MPTEFRSIMRFCGSFSHRHELARKEQRPQIHLVTGKSLAPALLPIDHADRGSALETRLAQGCDGLQRAASGRDDVLDDAHAFAGLEFPLDSPGRPVGLRLL